MAKKRGTFTTLTKTEAMVMNILWDLEGSANVREVQNHCEEPKPAYTSIATYLTILLNKGFVTQERGENGKAYYYRPTLTREEYAQRVMSEVKDNFFGGSAKSLVNFFCRQERMTIDEVQHLFQLITDGQM